MCFLTHSLLKRGLGVRSLKSIFSVLHKKYEKPVPIICKQKSYLCSAGIKMGKMIFS